MNLLTKMRTQFRNYVQWSNAAFFISGFTLGHSLVWHAVVYIIVSYLQEDEGATLRRSAIIVNAQEGLTSILVIIVAYFADTFGHISIISFSTVAYVVGFMLLWLLNPGDSGLYIIAAIPLAIGGAGADAPLRAFLYDQLKNNNKSLDSTDNNTKHVKAISRIWWHIPRFIGALIATFVLATNRWKTNFLISAIVMGCALLFFLSGFSCYHRENQNTANSLELIFHVIKAALVRHKLPYPNQPDGYFENDTNQLSPLMPDVLFSRWLDKAAIIERKSSSPCEEEQENQGTPCTVAQVKELKIVMRMVPIWATLLLFSLVKTTGSTFFFEQSNNLDDKITDTFRAPLISLYLIQRCSYYGILCVFNLIISKWLNFDKDRNYYLVATKVRIGIGLACACLCCIVARLVEIKRLHKLYIGDYDVVQEDTYVLHMSFFWLAPQFCLLGLSEGLVEEGIIEFIHHHTETLAEYGEAFNELVLGIGKLTSIFWVLTFSLWILDTVDNSHLHRYYGILAILSLGNLIVICYIITRYQ
ncbi:hypothetical protein LguiA_029393 [Lonicera macranthoides]